MQIVINSEKNVIKEVHFEPLFFCEVDSIRLKIRSEWILKANRKAEELGK